MRLTRSIPIRRCTALLALLVTATALSAQERRSPVPATGSRVRFTVRGLSSPVVGSFLSATADSIALVRASADTTTLARSAVNSFEVSSGVHHHVWRAIGWGAAGGVGAGAVLGAVTYSPCNETGFMACFMAPTNRAQSALLGAAIGTVLGTVGGLLVGAVHRSEDWHHVSVERLARVRVVPTAHSLGAQVSLAVR